MSDKLRESLSAVMDGEADEFELRRVLDEASDDVALREVWQRYHLVRGVLQSRRYGRVAATVDVVDSIWRRIDAGEGLDDSAGGSGSAPSWIGRVAGLAVAATVAIAVVLGFDLTRQDPGPLEQRPAVVAASVDSVALDAYPSRVDMQRTRAYMLHHAQHTSMYNQPGAVPFVKVLSFQGQ